MKIKLLIWIIVLLMISVFVSGIGVSPGTIEFYNTTRGGYAEQKVLISSWLEEDIQLSYKVSGVNWFDIEFEDEILSIEKAVNVIIKLSIPQNAGNGKYKSKIIILGNPKASSMEGQTSSVVMAVAIDVYIEIIGQELVSCVVGGAEIKDLEYSFPIELSANIRNEGNVIINPEVEISIFDNNHQAVLYATDYSTNEILPTTTIESFERINNNLEIGQYWAEINIPLCEYSEIITFSVVDKGEIVDKGELVKITSLNISTAGEITPINAFFKNTGSRLVSAKFQGQILRNGKIVDIIETDFVDVNPGEVEIFEFYYQPTLLGIYEIKGRVIYNNKLSYEKETLVEVTASVVKETDDYSPNKLLLFLIIVCSIIILLIMIIIKKKKLKM